MTPSQDSPPPNTLPDHKELDAMRTLMASKRTFLAWCRTAMALMGFGFILEKMAWYIQKNAGIQLEKTLHEMGILSSFAFFAGALIILLDALRHIRMTKYLASVHTWDAYLTEIIFLLALAGIIIVCILYSRNIII